MDSIRLLLALLLPSRVPNSRQGDSFKTKLARVWFTLLPIRRIPGLGFESLLKRAEPWLFKQMDPRIRPRPIWKWIGFMSIAFIGVLMCPLMAYSYNPKTGLVLLAIVLIPFVVIVFALVVWWIRRKHAMKTIRTL